MNFRRPLITTFSIFAFAIGTFAQNAPLGKDVVKSFSEKLQTYNTIRANFSFTLENLQEGFTDTHEGRIALKQKNYFLELMGMKVYYNGDTKWQFIPEANEVTISKPTTIDGGFFEDPTKIFQDYEKDFKSKFMGEKVENGRGIYEVELYPVDISVAYSIIKLQFDKKTLDPISIRYQGKDGNNYIIDIKRFEPNVEVKDSEFAFDPSKVNGIEIVDLR